MAGIGLNLRLSYLDQVCDTPPGEVDYWEVIAENLIGNPQALEQVKTIRAHTPIALHCVGMNLGGVDPISTTYLDEIAELERVLDPWLISDHFCWQRFGGVSHHDLLPLPLSPSTCAHVAARINFVQQRLGRSIALENLSQYVVYRQSSMTEAESLQQIAESTGCRLLLDLNNIEINAHNLGVPVHRYMTAEFLEHVVALHVAGPEVVDDFWLDTHGSAPSNWQQHWVNHLSHLPACYERDNAIPPLIESLAVVRVLKRGRKEARCSKM
ncbi:MAG: DUF692 domain-containing protein [Bradymonadia bacterium]